MWEIGFEEYLYKEGVCVIEWADTIRNLIPKKAVWIKVDKDLSKGENYRRIEVGR